MRQYVSKCLSGNNRKAADEVAKREGWEVVSEGGVNEVVTSGGNWGSIPNGALDQNIRKCVITLTKERWVFLQLFRTVG